MIPKRSWRIITIRNTSSMLFLTHDLPILTFHFDVFVNKESNEYELLQQPSHPTEGYRNQYSTFITPSIIYQNLSNIRTCSS